MPGRRPQRVAIDCGGEVTTYAELDARSDRLAAGLLEAGLAPGDRVATLTATSPEHVVVFFACAKVGTDPDAAEHAPRGAGAALPAGGRGAVRAPLLAGVRRARREPARANGAARGLATACCKVRFPSPKDGDGLLLVYTSGTTGKPKGALLTHANCFWTNLSFDRVAGLSAEDTVLQVLPQFHVGGWNVQPLLAWWKGATVVLEPAFDPARALQLIAEKRVTTMMGVPATYLFMAQDPGLRERGPLDAAARGGRRCADARGAARDVARAGSRDRPGLRPDRGRAERALPAAGGCGAEARLRRQALSARRRRAPRHRERPPARRLRRGRAARQGAERLRRLLAQHEATDAAFAGGWLVTGRRRRPGRRGLLPDRRENEGHGHLGRRERLSGRDRERRSTSTRP